ncbi:MAG TPA: ATP-binding cassette domain-containing protein [bacterium]|nr:ATP-binding cassette domain-containing protein [bacterium]
MLRIDRVVAGYHPGIDILSDLTLRAASGRITAVIGPNGAGKSTLLRVVFGLVRPRAGRVVFGDREIQQTTAYARKRLGIGYVPQGPSTFPQMTVEENLLVGGWTIRRDRPLLHQRLAHLYDLFPTLAAIRGSRATALSGGQLRMLSIAKELVASPTLLLVDEPTAGLAPRVADGVYDLLVRSRHLGVTVVLVDQNISEAVAVADDVYLIVMGRVEREGPREVFARDLRAIIRETLVGGPAPAS